MLDLGWTELLLIGIVALIVVGPKDLPVLFRNVGRFMGKARGMAREFSRAMNEAAEESGVKEATKGFKDMTSSKSLGLDGVENEFRSAAKWDPDSETAKLARERAAEAQARRDALRERKERGAAAAAGDADREAAASSETAPVPDTAPAAGTTASEDDTKA
ncbi:MULTISPECIES: Sec-independent protein translocase protein TatB [unclassified Rhodosalinus]|uniref:Sec-independent protein translocase protein TatB n=1 Tax=unclassified Rhodosalinus TaxID=2630183 RepID=UPI003523723F